MIFERKNNIMALCPVILDAIFVTETESILNYWQLNENNAYNHDNTDF